MMRPRYGDAMALSSESRGFLFGYNLMERNAHLEQ